MRKLTKYVVSIISSLDLDLTKSYRLQRTVMPFLHFRWIKLPIKRVDTKLSIDKYDIPLRVYFPENDDLDSLILFFHGGGFVAGNIASYDRLCTKMAKNFKKIVVSVDYRLAPEYPYPLGLDDCYEVAKAFFLHGFLFSIKSDNIILMGDSAGANLAAVVSLKARDEQQFYPKKQILIYPVVYHDHSETSPFLSVHQKKDKYLLKSQYIEDYFTLYVPLKEQRCHPYVAPLLSKDLSNQPSTLILTAELDPLLDEGKAYGERLRQAGNEVIYHQMDDCLHGFFNGNLNQKEVKQAFGYIEEFLSRNFHD